MLKYSTLLFRLINAIALAGAVVSNPSAKNTTSFCGFSRAIFRASARIDYSYIAAAGFHPEQIFFRCRVL
jgi:hypothetical protein